MSKSVKNGKKPVKTVASKKISRLQRKNLFLRFCLILVIIGVTVGLGITVYHLFNVASDESFWFDVITNRI